VIAGEVLGSRFSIPLDSGTFPTSGLRDNHRQIRSRSVRSICKHYAGRKDLPPLASTKGTQLVDRWGFPGICPPHAKNSIWLNLTTQPIGRTISRPVSNCVAPCRVVFTDT